MKKFFKDFGKPAIQWTVFWVSATVSIIGLSYAYAAFAPLAQVNTGDTLSKTAWNAIVTNLDDLNSRLSNIESQSALGTKGLSIVGTISSSSWTDFSVSGVRSNTLLPTNPTSSQITVAESGAYLLSSQQATCVTSNAYASTRILVNGSEVAWAVSYPNSCDSSSATVFRVLSAGDVVKAQCVHNWSVQTTCAFTMIKL